LPIYRNINFIDNRDQHEKADSLLFSAFRELSKKSATTVGKKDTSQTTNQLTSTATTVTLTDSAKRRKIEALNEEIESNENNDHNIPAINTGNRPTTKSANTKKVAKVLQQSQPPTSNNKVNTNICFHCKEPKFGIMVRYNNKDNI
jgi:hypothetical protein